MSKKKIFNIIELILQIFAIILLFVDGAYNCKYDKHTFSFVSGAIESTESGSLWWIILVLSLFAINTVLCIASIIKNKSDIDSLWHISIPILCFPLFFIGTPVTYNHSCIIINDRLQIFDISCEPELLTALRVTIILIIFVSFIKRSVVPKTKNTPQEIINNIQEASHADELKKFKELLDNGVITQEEFDAKKKQLLGL